MSGLSVLGCTGFLYSMDLDFYYGDSIQDEYGNEVNDWVLDQTLSGYAEILGAVDTEAIKAGTFTQYKDKLIGRTTVDPRTSSSGIQYPITSILVTNIRDKNTQTSFYNESYGERGGMPTLYDVYAIEPYVNPWNVVEYWKILLNRSDTQNVLS